MQTDMKIDLEEVLRKIADAVNSLRAYHMASELVIGMPEWLYNKIQEKRCDACGMQAEGYPRLFGITVVRLPMSHCVWVGKKIDLDQYKEGEF